jgi:hypothetical protein
VAPHDVVLASHILYPIAAVVPFVQKLVAHARRAWFITIRVEPMGGELGPIWEAIHHVPYPAEPVFLDLYNLLFAIGLRPDVRLRPFMGGPWRASSLAEAVTGTRARLFLADDDHRYDDQIEAFLRTAMREQDGAWHWPQQRLEAIVSGVTTPLNVPPSGGTEPLEGPR